MRAIQVSFILMVFTIGAAAQAMEPGAPMPPVYIQGQAAGSVHLYSVDAVRLTSKTKPVGKDGITKLQFEIQGKLEGNLCAADKVLARIRQVAAQSPFQVQEV